MKKGKTNFKHGRYVDEHKKDRALKKTLKVKKIRGRVTGEHKIYFPLTHVIEFDEFVADKRGSGAEEREQALNALEATQSEIRRLQGLGYTFNSSPRFRKLWRLVRTQKEKVIQLALTAEEILRKEGRFNAKAAVMNKVEARWNPGNPIYHKKQRAH